MLAQRVGPTGGGCRFSGEQLGLVVPSVARKRLRSKRAPRELRAHAVGGGARLADLGPVQSFVVAALPVDGLAELRCLGREVRLFPPLLQLPAALAEYPFGLAVLSRE